MNRRKFLATTAVTALAGPSIAAAELPGDLRVTRVVAFELTSRRAKLAGKNSRLDVHGDSAKDRMVRIYTNAGIEGLGNCRANREALAALVGKDPFSFYDADANRMNGPLGPGTMPLWDLLGKVTKKPVYELLGGAGPKRVPVYDGSIYFADLLPQYADRPLDRFKEEVDQGLERGHRAFKVKIGRGAKWMPRTEGDQRDIDVLTTIRKHGGDDILIGVDANNGYDLPGTKRLLDRLPDLRFAFVEEMFEEEIAADLELKRFIAERGWKTLVADGETQGDLYAYKPFIEARAIDIFQGDMNRYGIDGILTEAGWAREKELRVAPHNWGSLVGFYMQLHVGRAITNFYRAENDPLSNDVLIADGYTIRDGRCNVPEAPGFGLAINETRFATDVKITADLKA